MSDIAERLMRWSYGLANEEADMVSDAMTEIERLRAIEVALATDCIKLRAQRDMAIEQQALVIKELRAIRDELLAALDDLLNDCINFDDGNLTTVILKRASAVVAKAKEQP